MGNPIRNITLVAQADAQGRYDIAIEPGEYDVKISTPAGFTARHEKLRVAAGQAVALPRELTPGPRLRLRAIDSLTDRPVPGVQLYINEWRPGSISPRSGTERTTDEQGVTEWDKLIPGPTSISVRADGYTRWWLAEKGSRGNRAIDSLELNVRPGMEEVVVRMEPAMRVSGRVLSPDGEPVSGASVDVAGLETGDARYSKQSDAEGKFVVHFPNLDRVFASASRPARDYAIVAHDTRGRWANAVSEPFTAEPGQATDLTLRMTRGGRVRGRVVDPAGKPVAQIEVEAVARDGMDRAYYNPRALTDGDGRFDLGPMRGGDYTLQADTSFGVNIMYEPRQETRAITVKDGETVSAVQLIYQGPPPPPVPEWYYQTTGAPASRPAARQ